ncbi:hypothetical protein B9T31_16470 [Acinetobacter sp. ANC 4558]|uniref:fimbria/pilus outer membrane usher protein n=1 Tax=Acinetobacter sp. ANC 4558 TaxID=1977876 RepID=UPI000A344F35|nr:fimbria/pilus outer membrane usher protein [Acinetobacter sp. ANC 4558]OTG80103.1 hypothetical protein B9T31_16470 [Acinetobacter sp. ANC 4558]
MNNKVLLLFVFISSSNVYAVETEYTFNPDMLGFSKSQNIDLTKFENKNYIYPGQYSMSLYVNNKFYQTDVRFNVTDDNDKAIVCFNKIVTGLIPFDEKFEKSLIFDEKGCLDLSNIPGFEYSINLSEQDLKLKIPQAYLQYSSENWDPPKLWSNGINGFLLDYNLNINASNQISKNKNIVAALNGVTGFNIEEWRIRGEWQSRYQDQHNDHGSNNSSHNFKWDNIYAYRALKSIKADLLIGETYLSSNLFNSFNYTGISLESNEEMLPPNLRYYAPEVTGIANTNALVTISQLGRVLYSTQVPAGNFSIRDLPNYANGILDVKVEEQDGTVQNFQVNTIAAPYLTRPGRIRYKTAIGQPRNDHHLIHKTFISGEMSYGLNNMTSLIAGALSSKDYHNINIGLGQDLNILGAFAINYLNSNSSDFHGNGYRFSYNKSILNTRLQASTSFFDRNYQEFSDYLGETGRYSRSTTIVLNQSFPLQRASISVSYSQNKQAEDADINKRLDINLTKYFNFENYKNVSTSLSFYRNIDQNDYGAYLRVSFPFNTNGSISYNANQSKNNDFSSSISYFNRINEATSYSMGVGHDGDKVTATSFFTHQANSFTANISSSYRDKEFASVSAGLRGGITVTAKGADIHRINMLGSTRLLVDTDQVSDIPVQGYSVPSYSNRFGKVVTPDVRDYYRNRISIDLNKLPDNADTLDSVKAITLTKGAIGYQKFAVTSGEKGMVTLLLADGQYPYFGAEVRNEEGVLTGIVGEQGRTYLTGVSPGKEMKIMSSGNCQILVPKEFSFKTNTASLVCR